GPDHPPVDIGGRLRLPVSCSGSASHSWWAMIMLIMVCASIFSVLLFAYLFLWTTSPEVWPDSARLPAATFPLTSVCLLIGSSEILAWLGRSLKQSRQEGLGLGLPIALLMLLTAVGLEAYGQWQTGLRPQASSYAAAVYAVIVWLGVLTMVLCYMSVFTVARSLAGRLTSTRRACYDSTMIFWHYTVAQGLLSLELIHGFSR